LTERRPRRRHERSKTSPRRQFWIFTIGFLALVSAGLSLMIWLAFYKSVGVIDVPGFSEAIVPPRKPIVLALPEAVSKGLMTDLSELPLEARPKRYRELADDAEREAARATGSTRTSYLRIAEQWRALASAVQAMSKDNGSNGLK
jgi:hypothetical protein